MQAGIRTRSQDIVDHVSGVEFNGVVFLMAHRFGSSGAFWTYEAGVRKRRTRYCLDFCSCSLYTILGDVSALAQRVESISFLIMPSRDPSGQAIFEVFLAWRAEVP
jgi:hypothetical protein